MNRYTINTFLASTHCLFPLFTLFSRHFAIISQLFYINLFFIVPNYPLPWLMDRRILHSTSTHCLIQPPLHLHWLITRCNLLQIYINLSLSATLLKLFTLTHRLVLPCLSSAETYCFLYSYLRLISWCEILTHYFLPSCADLVTPRTYMLSSTLCWI